MTGGTFCGGRWVLDVCAIPEFLINVHDPQVGERMSGLFLAKCGVEQEKRETMACPIFIPFAPQIRDVLRSSQLFAESPVELFRFLPTPDKEVGA
jgi:hypothetical protein